ncbi:MAG: hypothetical protein PF590_04830, partial [Candidatus Delongbacteria bacterium]|nr:hypothetical protein [Candidatus Delongbacteria bacterium]
MQLIKKIITGFTLILIISSFNISNIFAQITAPNATESFSTDYSSGYIDAGGENDLVFVFCGDQDEPDIGELEVENATGCSVTWFQFDGVSYQPMGITGITASGLTSGGYMAQVECAGVVNCYRAWVWVNQTFVNVEEIDPSCEEFTLHGEVDPLDTEFDIVDPPGMNFEVDEETEILVCFWADHTYVSDIGFYLKAPGHEADEPEYPVNSDGNHAVVELLPPVSNWGDNTSTGSTSIPASALGCSNPDDVNTVCQSGNNIENFCFSSQFDAGNPTLTPCVCDMSVPLANTYASVGPWDAIYGFNAGDDGWAVQIYDCEEFDYGSLNQVLINFTAETECGETSFIYNSGDISGLPSSEINDNSCDAATASYFIVPPEDPPGAYTVTSSITEYLWTCDNTSFTSTDLDPTLTPGTPAYPTETSNFLLHATETIDVIGSPSCEQTATEEFITLPADATISPIAPMCADDSPVQINVADPGGEFSVGAGTDSDAVQNGIFYPEVAGPGTHTIYYDISEPCPDSDDIDVIVYENIEIQNFSDNVCDGADENYTVSFDVVEDPGGSPAEFQVNDGGGFESDTGSFSQDFPSANNYNLTVTDLHNCDNIVLEGYTDCGCTTYAGTMSSLQMVNLCEGECTGGAVGHEGNQALDANDVFEFILHDGSEYPADATSIIDRNSTPDFCMTGGMTYDTTYYISAVCGNEEGTTGHVVSDPSSDLCYSQSTGTPVVWHENPVVTIDETNVSVCGLTVDLTGSVPTAGMGTWISDSSFNAISGTTIHDNVVSILAGDGYGEYLFTWEIDNNQCTGSDDVTVNFNQTPNAYAGNDTTVCGSSVELNAEYSITGANGYWSAEGVNFSQPASPNATATLSSGNYGTYVLTWTESNLGCSDDDYLSVTFVEQPQPTVSNSSDVTCGLTYNLHVDNVMGEGTWTAWEDGNQVYPTFDDDTSPTTIVTINGYAGGHSRSIDFQWEETNTAYGLPCTNSVITTITFYQEPFASVGETDYDEVCGNQYTFDADTTNYGWAFGKWIAKDIGIIEWIPDNNIPDPTVTIQPGAFGDSAHVEAEFIWRMTSDTSSSTASCTDLDTISVTFYKKPNANAGSDDSICGLQYDLEAFYNLPETDGYTPYGFWTAYNDTNPGTANFADFESPATMVNVSQPGDYYFIWRENNSLRSSCNDRDTVMIEFKEKPVISAGEDFDVCGKNTSMNAVSAGFDGNWLDVPGATYDNPNDPNTSVSYHAGYGDITFIWQEANEECTSKDTVVVTFWQEPNAQLAMDAEDTAVCGRKFNLRAENPGSGVNGNWVANPSNSVDFYFNTYNDTVEVTYYGYYDFNWVLSNHPANEPPTFCSDTSEPWTVHFIEIPQANAGNDTLFCGLSGQLEAEFATSTSTGQWADFSGNIT